MPKALLDLEKILGDKEIAAFYQEWSTNGMNSTTAYMKLHPNVSRNSARVLGSRMLAKVNLVDVADAYGLDKDIYFKQLKEGVQAFKRDQFTGEIEADHKTRLPYHTKLGKILGVEVDTPPVAIENKIVIMSQEVINKYAPSSPSADSEQPEEI